jgi:peptide-methionine (S)-S-oxide reductase
MIMRQAMTMRRRSEEGRDGSARRGGRLRPWLAAVVAAGLMGLAAAPGTGAQETARATFAGGCFWCMEPPFDQLDGVLSTTSGYTGGPEPSPTYEQVSSGKTGHVEAVEIVYDPRRITYATLLDVFWRNIDPLTANAQFCDVGPHYRSVVFVHDATQRRLAEESRRAVAGRLGKPVVTEIVAASAFWPAEDYHQDYYRKNPVRYKVYRTFCGRDRRLEEIWGPPAKAAAGPR